MCGIFGYVGDERSVPGTVGVALKSLEYRGYDSWGMVWQAARSLHSVKKTGKVPTSFTFEAASRIAIGHTRWATHGGVTDANAHPHLDSSGRLAVVHNGIVENALELRANLLPLPRFASETDTEVIAHLLGQRVEAGSSIVEAMCAIFPLLSGQNAVIAIDQQEEVIAAAMNVSPLVIGTSGTGSYISSDPFALAGKAKTMIVAPNDAVMRLGPDGISAFTYLGESMPLPDPHPVPDASSDELGGYRHFMEKEMAEQPAVLESQVADPGPTLLLGGLVREASTVVLTGCGSAYFASRIGASWLATLPGIRALAVAASEFDEVVPFLDSRTLVVAVTQSGETADILEAMRTARAHGTTVATLVNVEHSSAVRIADHVIPIRAGRERSVLATKSMVAMLGRLLAATTGCTAGMRLKAGSNADAGQAIANLSCDAQFEQFVERTSRVIAASDHVYVIGKGTGHGVAQEAALKIKEASYVHAEAFSAGELKHGAIALIESGTPCLVFGTDARYRVDTGSSAQELRSRGGYTIGVGQVPGGGVEDVLALPDLGPANPLVHVFVAQQIAYRTALLRNLDPDYPRNLAKSVTVK